MFKPGDLLDVLSPEVIDRTVCWWDDLRAQGKQVGAGLLREALKDGGTPGYAPLDRTAPCHRHGMRNCGRCR